ncbi:MAG TPA: aldolase/citrate lyase family protein [Candidatus Limnocylindrales bacterium]
MTLQRSLLPVPGFTDLRARILAGATLFGTFLALGSPTAAEICGRAGFDWVIIDLEHGAAHESDLLANLHAVGSTPATALVRPRSGDRLRVGRVLDLGAHGVMIPRIDLPAQAAEAVSFMRYPPDGTRGLALSTRGAGLGELGHGDVRAVNQRIVGIIQIESPSAVEHAPEIAAIDGVDVLFVGPADLSHSMGIPGQFDDARFVSALEQVVAAADGAGKAAGILLFNLATLPRHLELGFRFIGLGSEAAFVAEGARTALAAAAATRG